MPWQENPYKLWSLWEMMERLGRFLKFFEEVEQLRSWLNKEETAGVRETQQRQRLEGNLGRWSNNLFAEFGFAYEARRASDLSTHIRRRTPGAISKELQELVASFQESALKRFVYIVDAANNDCLDEGAMPRVVGVGFGEPVDSAFPSAAAEIREARLCYALGRPTACVFHLMRAVEYGLRELAVSVGVTKPKKPLEFQTWYKIIKLIDDEYKGAKVYQWSEPEKSNAEMFFSSTFADLDEFKTAIRNVLMHTRSGGTYDEPGAVSVMNRVQAFMERLAGKLSEGGGVNLLTLGNWA